MYKPQLINSFYCSFYEKTANDRALLTLERQLYTVADTDTVKELMKEAFDDHIAYSLENKDESIAKSIIRLVENYEDNFNLTLPYYLKSDTALVISRSKGDGLYTFSDGSALFVSYQSNALSIGTTQILTGG